MSCNEQDIEQQQKKVLEEVFICTFCFFYNKKSFDHRFMTVLYFLEDTKRGGQTAFPVAGLDPYLNNLTAEIDVSIQTEVSK